MKLSGSAVEVGAGELRAPRKGEQPLCADRTPQLS